jgi:hypothetical protein
MLHNSTLPRKWTRRSRLLIILVADMASTECEHVARTGLARYVVIGPIRIREACALEVVVAPPPPTTSRVG